MTSGPLACRTCTRWSPRYFPRSFPHRQRIDLLTISRSNTGRPPTRMEWPPKRSLHGDKIGEFEVAGLVENADLPGATIAGARRATPATGCSSRCELGHGTDATSCSSHGDDDSTGSTMEPSNAASSDVLARCAPRRKAMHRGDMRDNQCDRPSRWRCTRARRQPSTGLLPGCNRGCGEMRQVEIGKTSAIAHVIGFLDKPSSDELVCRCTSRQHPRDDEAPGT